VNNSEQEGPAKEELLGAGEALGLLKAGWRHWFKVPVVGSLRATEAADSFSAHGTVEDIESFIDRRIAERAAAKKARDFARADAIRDELAAAGIVIEDTAQGVRWSRKRA
jgi:cysteinyl-tRNA synthetase